MENNIKNDIYGENLEVGDKHYRAWVGPPKYYDLMGAFQFYVMTSLGLREYNTFLDIGCGSLRSGKFLIMYLRPGNYHGLEPEATILEQGKLENLGKEFLEKKNPMFTSNYNFDFSAFKKSFDFLLAHSIFTHSSQKQITECLISAKKVMTDNSIFVATIDESSTKNYEGDEWVYPGITEYTRSKIQFLVEQQDLKCTFLDMVHPWGQTWLVITKKNKDFNYNNFKNNGAFSPRNFLGSHREEEINENIKKLRKEQLVKK